jgi:RNA polymerase sigma-70 factor (ECF subfamily)
MITFSTSPPPWAAPPPAEHGRPTDAQVVARSISDPSAFTAIFDRHHGAIHRYLLRRLPGAVADDVASETFLRAFDARGRFDATRADSARPWLFGIAVNLARRHHRDERRGLRALLRHGVSRDGSATDFDAIHGRLDAAARELILGAALRGLSDRLRQPLLLHVWGELTYAEVAVALDVPIGTVRSRIARARDELRSALPTEDRS